MVPVLIILVLILGLAIVTNGQLIKSSTLISLLKQSMPYMIAGLGMVFVMSMGSIDMSIGVNICISATLGYLLVGDSGSWPMMFIACTVIGALIGFFNGGIAALFNVPSFMVTIAVQIGLRGAINAYFLASETGRIVFRSNILALTNYQIRFYFNCLPFW